MNEPDVMVYLMTGFLDSGKTGFLKFTLKQDYFQIDGKTLLILCEDGEDEYDAMEMLRYGVVIERLEDREELTEEYLAELDRKHEPDRAVSYTHLDVYKRQISWLPKFLCLLLKIGTFNA